MNIFQPANVLLPQVESMEKWAVIACDQYTSQPEYWERVRSFTDGAASTLNLILPEAEMEQADTLIEKINTTMNTYINAGVFKEYENVYIYVERTLVNGTIRKGIVGVVDLEQYDYSNLSKAAIRATERTVEERIPPRMNIRRNASIELPHILLLCDDEEHQLLESIESIKDSCPKLYDFDLMEAGGHIAGWLVEGQFVQSFNSKLNAYESANAKKYEGTGRVPMVFAVGDGNHSLATAKACYEELKKLHPDKDLSNHPARYALVELENIHDEAQQFEPIHRILTEIDTHQLLQTMKETICSADGHPIISYIGDKEETLYLDRNLGELPVAILQKFLDEYLETNSGKIDYIHGDDVVRQLAMKANSVGFLLPDIEKNQFFRGIVMDGVLPRKTFSMGHAQEKRYYIEGRTITE